MNLAFFNRVSVSFIRPFGCIVVVRAVKSIVGAPKILCLDSECAGQSFIRCSAVSSIFCRLEQSLQYFEEAVFSLPECLLSSLCPVRAFVIVLSEFFDRFMRISCASSLSSVRLKIGEQSSLRLLFCQFAFLSLSAFFMYLVILCLWVV